MTAQDDTAQRERFATELDHNFSVRASAGSGKTFAITQRILSVAKSSRAEEWLPQLVVVTFTNRAADEMQQRSRQLVLESGVGMNVISAFDRAFFGTIHSFCVRLLRAHAHALGLPSKSEVVTDDGPLWRAFLQKYTRVGAALPEDVRKRLFRHVRVSDILALGRRCAHDLRVETPDDLCEELDCTRLLDYVGTHKSGIPNIQRSQKAVREWLSILRHSDDFAPLPGMFGKSKKFIAEWNATFAPLHEWLQRAALCAACETARAFREFRLRHGALDYDDQVALARELLRFPEVARRIREKNHRVILDEAQDTDPEQFALLVEVGRSPEAEGEWPVQGAPPRPGHFCMVGDFQQSIYGTRADLDYYRRVHEALAASPAGEALTFSATFRLDEAPLRIVNATFPPILNEKDGQVPFVPLAPRREILPGQVMRLEIPSIDVQMDGQKAWHEAKLLGRWIAETGLEPLRAVRWSDVAIICPRKSWFPTIRNALRSIGIAAQLQSDREIRGDHPAVAWFSALIVIMAEPENAFEIVGVLREVFGISDHELAEFSRAERECFTLSVLPNRTGEPAEALRLLHDLRSSLEEKALLAQAQEIVRATRLRDRLLSLPGEEYEALDETLDDLLIRVAAAEAEGLTLFQLAERLRNDFEASRESRPVQPDAIQVITGHKAKGSEWPVVILPFFARTVKSRSPVYPMIYRDAEGETRVAFSEREMSDESKAFLKLRERQEAERLLYVAMTRVRHTLVILDDRDLFATSNGLAETSQAHLLQAAPGRPAASLLESLPTVAVRCSKTMRARKEIERRREGATAQPLPIVDPTVTSAARLRATQFVKRNPSTLAHLVNADPTKAPERDALAMAASPVANQYGSWWHLLMEHLDWRDPSSWQQTFEEHLPQTPDPDRAAREWPLFLSVVAARTEVTGAKLTFHSEMPFLWRSSDTECIEGIADLVIFDAAAGGWLIVDWKTNYIQASYTSALKDQYLPQLAAYRAAFQAILGGTVSAAIYSTATGEWLPYDNVALDHAWDEISLQPGALESALMT